jgi:D-arabinose 1-dehydrogenase-like Zn-dependent alcohol dehydrogenase
MSAPTRPWGSRQEPVRSHGDVTIVGTGGGALPVSFFGLPCEVSVQTSRWGSRPELIEVPALAAHGQIQPITKGYRLEDAVRAYADLRDGRVAGRAVMQPSAKPSAPRTKDDRPCRRGCRPDDRRSRDRAAR